MKEYSFYSILVTSMLLITHCYIQIKMNEIHCRTDRWGSYVIINLFLQILRTLQTYAFQFQTSWF